MKQNKKIISGAVLVLLLTAAVLAAVWLFNSGFPKARRVDITISKQYPPFTEYALTDAEADKFIACLSAMDFPERIEGPPPMADGLTCIITAEGENHTLEFARPYLVVDGTLYRLNMDEEIFDIVDSIIDARQ